MMLTLNVPDPNSNLSNANGAHIERTHGHLNLGNPNVAIIERTRPQF